MARMIPPTIDDASSPPGEVQLFHLFAKSAGTESWIVLHSLDLPQHVRNLEGEIDFLILVPGGAAICLEVKSHKRVRRESNGLWRLGNDAPDARGPFKQSAEAMWSIHSSIKARALLTGVPLVSAVAFPLCEFDQPPTEWEAWQVFDENALSKYGVVGVATRIVNGARSKFANNAAWFHPSANEPTSEQCASIARLLRPSFEFNRSPKARKNANNAEMLRYTEEQFAALDAVCDNDRVIFTGAAGTGKTLLAIEAARLAVADGKRTLLTCYNRLLAGWIQQQASPLGPAAEIGTLHSVMLAITGLNVPPEADDTFWSHQLPSETIGILVAGHPMARSFDLAVVDEAQDLCSPQYLDVLDQLLKGGLEQGKVMMFGDFDRQAIYTGEDARDFATSRSFWSKHNLTENCRNRPRVGHLAGAISGPGRPYRKFRRPDDGVDFDIDTWSTLEEQTRKLAERIDKLRVDGQQLGDIVILSPLTSGAASTLGSPHREWLSPAGDNRAGRIRYSTIHAFKGLEATAVIVTDLQGFTTLQQRQLVYVAASRATERLVLSVHEAAAADLFTLVTKGAI